MDSFGKRGMGRPPEDRFRRRMEIYQAVSPLIMERGASRLGMREISRAAALSVGGLYHYFGSKRELLLYPILPETCQEQYRRFRARWGHLVEHDPQGYLDAFLEFLARTSLQVRPAVRAALEIGAGDFWEMMQETMRVEMEDLLDAIHRARQEAGLESPDRAWMAHSIRRTVMGALMDAEVTPEELEAQLRAVVDRAPEG